METYNGAWVRGNTSRSWTINKVIMKILCSLLSLYGIRAIRWLNGCWNQLSELGWIYLVGTIAIVEKMKETKECNRSTQASHHTPRNKWWLLVKMSWLKWAQILIDFHLCCYFNISGVVLFCRVPGQRVNRGPRWLWTHSVTHAASESFSSLYVFTGHPGHSCFTFLLFQMF